MNKSELLQRFARQTDERAQKALSMYARHQAALAELTQSVLANTELSTIMHQAVTLVADTLAVAYSAIWQLSSERDTLALQLTAGGPANALGATTAELAPTSLIGATALGSSPVTVTDWPTETHFKQPQLLRDHGVISSLAVVIPGRIHPFGSLSVDVSASRIFNAEEIAFLQVVANVLALAFERFTASQAIAEQVEARAKEIEARLVVAAQDQAVLEERQRLARDLHDSVTQALYSVTLHAQGAQRLLAAGEVTTTIESLRVLQDTAQEALDEMRLLIFDLRPPILEQVGLESAIQARLNAVEGRANLQTKFIADGIAGLPPPLEQALYRIAQEALNNALKHAHAQQITVRLQQAQSSVTLEIIDDGDGFYPADAHEGGGVGLRGIAERVAQLNGTLTVRSAPGTGTQLRVEVTQ